MGADSKPDLSVECKVLDGVLPLQDQQQVYGDTHTVYMVYNTQDKQAYYKHEFIARGTDIMTAERETEAMRPLRWESQIMRNPSPLNWNQVQKL